MGTKKKINAQHCSATSFRPSPDFNQSSVNDFNAGLELRSRSPGYNTNRYNRGHRTHLGGVGGNIRLYNSCQTLLVTSPSPSTPPQYLEATNHSTLRGRHLSSFSTSSSFIKASTFARSGNSSKHKGHHAIVEHSFQRCSNTRYNGHNSVSSQEHDLNLRLHDQRDSSSYEDDYSVSGEDECSTLCYDISADDIHEAPKLHGSIPNSLVSQKQSLSSELPSYSLWRRQMITTSDLNENYLHQVGSGASYYTSESAKALMHQNRKPQSFYQYDDIAKDSEHSYEPNNTHIKRKDISTTTSDSFAGKPSLPRKSSHQKSTKRRTRTTSGGEVSKIPSDISFPNKSSLKKQLDLSQENGRIPTQKVLPQAQVTRRVSMKRRKSMRLKHSERSSSQNKRASEVINNRGYINKHKELKCIDERDNKPQAVQSIKASHTLSTLKSCRSMSEFETLPSPTRYPETRNGNICTGKLKSISINKNSSNANHGSANSKMLEKECDQHRRRQHGLFISKEMYNKDKKYHEVDKLRSKTNASKHKNIHAVNINSSGHGKVCCGGTACCNER